MKCLHTYWSDFYLGGGSPPAPISAISLLVEAVVGHLATRLENEDDCDGAEYLAPVQSEPAVRLLTSMVDGSQEPEYHYSGTVLNAEHISVIRGSLIHMCHRPTSN